MKLKINVDGKMYEVDVEVAEDQPGAAGPGYPSYYAPRSTATVPPQAGGPPPAAPAPAGPPAGTAVDDAKIVRSPLAGVVVRINTHPGQQIQKNDTLLVLEAMKMETNVTSPDQGTVKALHVNTGEAVAVGQVVVEFE